MIKDTMIEAPNPAEGPRDDLTDLLREGAKRLIAQAVDAELSATLAEFADYKDEAGRRYVVRNGYLPEREIMTGIGPVSVRVPKVRDRSGSQIKFTSALLPPYLRCARSVEEVFSEFGPGGSDSIPEVHILQWLFNVHLFHERNGLLQIVTFLAGHPKLASLDRNLDFDLSAFDRFGDFAS